MLVGTVVHLGDSELSDRGEERSTARACADLVAVARCTRKVISALEQKAVCGNALVVRIKQRDKHVGVTGVAGLGEDVETLRARAEAVKSYLKESTKRRSAYPA